MYQWPLYYSVLIIVILAPSMMFGAGPLMHIYLAQQWFNLSQKYDEAQKALFMNGTLFNDIRYIAGLSRETTHQEGITLDMVLQESNAFKAGMYFHIWVDERRGEYADPYLLLLVGNEPGNYTFIKSVEDEIMYDRLDHEYYARLVKAIPQEEYETATSLGITTDMLVTWHDHLVYHIQNRPIDIIATLAHQQKGYLVTVSSDMVKRWHILLPIYSTSDIMRKYVDTMIQSYVVSLQQALT